MEKKNILGILLLIVLSFLIWSLIKPNDYLVWLLEIFPALIGIAILAITYKRFEFTTMVYVFVAIHSIILIIGGHYTYAENPLFNWLKDYFHLSRNYYDRLGHVAQGFFPAIVIRELLLRTSALKKGKWQLVIVIGLVLAISASYELFEWGTALTVDPGAGDAFLATQGDIWDTQWDMLLALLGGIASLLIFSKEHDRELRELNKKK